jgi:hypothetical protein
MIEAPRAAPPGGNPLLEYVDANAAAFADERRAWAERRAALLAECAALSSATEGATFEDQLAELERAGLDLALACLLRTFQPFRDQLDALLARVKGHSLEANIAKPPEPLSIDVLLAQFPRETRRMHEAMSELVFRYTLLNPSAEQFARFEQCLHALMDAGFTYGAAVIEPLVGSITAAIDGREA